MPFLILQLPFDKFPFSVYFILTEPNPLLKIILWLHLTKIDYHNLF